MSPIRYGLFLIVPAVFALAWRAAGEDSPSPREVLAARVEKALADSSDWMIFRSRDGIERLKYLGENRYYYPEDGDTFKLVVIDGKPFAGRLDGGIFEPHWENRTSFAGNFVPAVQVAKNLERQSQSTDASVRTLQARVREQQRRLDNLLRRSKELTARCNELRREENQDLVQEEIAELELQQSNLKNQMEALTRENQELEQQLKARQDDADNVKTQYRKYRAKPVLN